MFYKLYCRYVDFILLFNSLRVVFDRLIDVVDWLIDV